VPASTDGKGPVLSGTAKIRGKFDARRYDITKFVVDKFGTYMIL
jgi:hypothetical protein